MAELDTKQIQMKCVLVLYVGGAIGMKKNEEGAYVPISNHFLNTVKNHSQMHDSALARAIFKDVKENQCVLPLVGDCAILYEIHEYDPLLDSSNMSTKDWVRMVQDIDLFYKDFDGFVILQGTDTMTYSASALSFMLHGLSKPVIITGSVIPIYEFRSDAEKNFVAAIILAAIHNIPEVCICFSNKLFRGNRTSKMSSSSLEVFNSPNYHPLARIGTDIRVNHHYSRKIEDSCFQVRAKMNQNVAVLTFFPTLTASMIEGLLQPSVEGLVLVTYGAGNIPSHDTNILNVLKKIVERGVLVVNVTQCSHGCVTAAYETGKELENLGIIPGNDMTVEAAFTKLCYILGCTDMSREEKIIMLKANLKGELTSVDQE